MKNLYGYTLQKLEDYFISIGEKKFKANQVFDWVYKKRISSLDEMTNIKEETLNIIKKDFNLSKLEIIDRKSDVGVRKYLFKLHDNNKIEAVLMHHDYGDSLCISTQVGCNMGCSFCESGRLKKVRNLEVHEMILQILMVEADLDVRISHIVLMGIGEPFDNYDNVMDFFEIAKNPKAIQIGARHMTVSTCGIIPKIKEFMEKEDQVNLAISLHASNDALRSKLMPINKVYPLRELISALKEYIKKTNRRVTFEYVMLKGINDQKEHAVELSKLLKGMNAYVNLIPYNETSHIEYQKSDKDSILDFYDILKQNKIQVTIRKEFGSKVMAACGQLRSNYEEK
jgi:23S rRNA (adenine2503-C2)-methyltransferase